MDTSDYAHFAAIPWCSRHLQGGQTITGMPLSRVAKSTGEDSLFAETLNSDRAIVRMLRVYMEPISPEERVNEVKAFLTLGSGLNGYPDVCHGGIVTTILDEVIGMLVPINQDRRKMPPGTYMTAYLNTTFLRPVPTPATVLVRTWFTKVEGRKYFTQGTIEDENGVTLARADALYILLKSSL